jgi:hypothetical protein
MEVQEDVMMEVRHKDTVVILVLFVLLVLILVAAF